MKIEPREINKDNINYELLTNEELLELVRENVKKSVRDKISTRGTTKINSFGTLTSH